MLTIRCSEQLRTRIFDTYRKYIATATQHYPAPFHENDEEYTAVAQYPEIRDLSFKARKAQSVCDWHEKIRQVPTIEEKMIKLNMPRYYGYKVVDLSDTCLPYNMLPMTQHYTRTELETLPVLDEQQQKGLDSFVEEARADVLETLELTHDFFKNQPLDENLDIVARERQIVQFIVEQINRSMLLRLSPHFAHLKECVVDYNPRHEAFWAVGGIQPPKNVVKSRKGCDWQKEMANDPVDRLVQYTGAPYLALRHHQQLTPWKTETEYNNLELAQKIPRYNYDPRTLGYAMKYQHAINVPGYWPGTAKNFGLLSFQSRAHLQIRPSSYGSEDLQEALHALAIQASYAWLLAQAYYNGFNTYNELTYPMNTQTVYTNGREWSFYEYQLNTLLLYSDHVDKNPRVNFCRGTTVLKLYDSITAEGKCVGLNDDVLRYLIRFYVNRPTVERSIEQLQPYVGVEGTSLRYIADYPDADRREFLDKVFKYLCSKRPRHREIPEIYLWEKIYKIDNKTRPLEARRRFFELGINPWRRTLDQHDKEYIPRAMRPGGPKSRDRFKKTYYP